MHFNLISILAFASLASTTAIPEVGEAPMSLLDKRDSYSCKGNALCGSTANLRSWCDNTVNNKIIRNNVVNYGAPGSGLRSGECTGNLAGFGCGVFVEGPSSCKMTGNQIWYAYQDIRGAGCKICGQKIYSNGCKLTINRVSGC